MSDLIVRSAPLTDIDLDGDGRTVVAYATPFGVPNEVIDRHGHYYEIVRHTAFDKSLAESFGSVQVFYNHGMTIQGTPASEFSVPIGTPLEITPDRHGLKTVTRYDLDDPLSARILQAIKDKRIKSMSYTAKIMRSTDRRKLPGHRIPTLERVELALREYGPTPIPMVAHGADIVAVRSSILDDPAVFLDQLDDDERARLYEALTVSTPPAAPPDEGTPPAAPETPPTPSDVPPPDEGTGDGAPSIVDRLALEHEQRKRRLAS